MNKGPQQSTAAISPQDAGEPQTEAPETHGTPPIDQTDSEVYDALGDRPHSAQVSADDASSNVSLPEPIAVEEESDEEYEARSRLFEDVRTELEQDEDSMLEENEDGSETKEAFDAKKQLYKDILSAMDRNTASDSQKRGTADAAIEDDAEEDSRSDDPDFQAAAAYLDYSSDAADAENSRTHPLTEEGRFATFPSSVIIPRQTMVEPVAKFLDEVSKNHLHDAAVKTFGGPHLPNSTATPSNKLGHFQQQPIALEASHSRMSPMEANTYLAAIMPGAYASVSSVLVETRKRLGSKWLQELMEKPGGPRILDAGSAGAGVLAWHDILRAEWARLHPETAELEDAPLGKATVVTGSSELRLRVSPLLDNTTFLPRLPEFDASKHLPSSKEHIDGLRKQYDVIVAPYTLWTLREEYMRKARVQNYWSLLNPNGGVLLLIEKGVPRGFELVAGARNVLLKHHISSPGSEHIESKIASTSDQRYIPKEEGMIVAPCTNHSTCPMYPKPGEMKARKDYCHFVQRFERPPYLQRLLGASFRNHEDIRFSYLAVRRGHDERKTYDVAQDENTTLKAVTGYEDAPGAHMLALPRIVLPPLKRHKHVVFDMCTPAAQIERWTVSAAFSKQAYRDARKARWGDLWALGAKSRVVRRVRDGIPNDMPRKRVIEIGVGGSEEGDSLRDVSRGYQGTTRGHGVRREQRMRRVSEKDML